MSKPFMGVSASGCHHNISFWRGGGESVKSLGNDRDALPGMDNNFTYLSGGENTFMPDTDDVQLPGKVGLQVVGGIVTHLAALTAIGCSTVNSYRRLWDTGFWAPVFADWGYQKRTTGLRISAPGRFEYRAVDSMVNSHLMAGAIIKAADDGIRRDIDPGPPEDRNIYQAMEAGKQVKRLPMTLGDSLEALKNDDVIRSALPGEMYRLFAEYKTRRMGALPPYQHRVGHGDLPRLPALTGSVARPTLCGAGGVPPGGGGTDGGGRPRLPRSPAGRNADPAFPAGKEDRTCAE